MHLKASLSRISKQPSITRETSMHKIEQTKRQMVHKRVNRSSIILGINKCYGLQHNSTWWRTIVSYIEHNRCQMSTLIQQWTTRTALKRATNAQTLPCMSSTPWTPWRMRRGIELQNDNCVWFFIINEFFGWTEVKLAKQCLFLEYLCLNQSVCSEGLFS